MTELERANSRNTLTSNAYVDTTMQSKKLTPLANSNSFLVSSKSALKTTLDRQSFTKLDASPQATAKELNLK